MAMATTPAERIAELGIKQTWLARELGISQSYLHDLLNGKRGIESLPALAPRIADLCRVPVADLFPGLEG